jgi:hypothetical protein
MFQDRLIWGFATTSSGDVVVRNWSFVTAFLIGTIICGGLGITALLYGALSSIMFLMGMLYFSYAIYLEALGIVVSNSKVIYPIRIGFRDGWMPLFRRIVSAEDVLQVSSQRRPGGMYVAYLSGEFGEARIVFDTKGGRDRFFAVLHKRIPRIKIYRWT